MVETMIRTPRAILRAVISEVARERRLDPEVIVSSRSREVKDARAAVAKRLFARGVAEERIARMMRTHLATVQSYLGNQGGPT